MQQTEQELLRRAKSGDMKAKEQLILHNMGIIVQIAKVYLGKGLDFEDLIQEGCIGLLKAIEKYDEKVGVKFVTYATWWIMHYIQRAVAEKGNLIRLPVRRLLEIQRDKREGQQNMYKKKVVSLDNIMVRGDKREEYLTFMETLRDDKDYENDIVEKLYLSQLFKRTFQYLSEKERKIMLYRHVLEWDFNRIGRIFGVSRVRVQQIEKKAKLKLKRILEREIMNG